MPNEISTNSTMEDMNTEEQKESKETEPGLLPFNQKWVHIAFYAILTIWAVYLLYRAQNWNFEDRTLPVIGGGTVIVLSMLQMIKFQWPELMENNSEEETTGEQAKLKSRIEEAMNQSNRSKRVRQRYEIFGVAWTLLLGVLVYLFGLIVAMPVFLFAFIMFFHRDLKTAIAVVAGFMIFMYLVFIRLFNVILWDGVIDLPF